MPPQGLLAGGDVPRRDRLEGSGGVPAWTEHHSRELHYSVDTVSGATL